MENDSCAERGEFDRQKGWRMTAGRRGKSLTAAGGVVGWKMTAGCMGRGEVGRQQGGRMTAGQRGESLAARRDGGQPRGREGGI